MEQDKVPSQTPKYIITNSVIRDLQKILNRFNDINFFGGGVRVCGIAVLGYFWCGVAVIFISKYGIAVFRDQAVCGEYKFYVAVVGEKIVVSR